MRYLPFVALIGGCIVSGAESPFPDPVDAGSQADALALGPTFQSLQVNVFAPKCGRPCHGGPDAPGALDMVEDVRANMVHQPAAGRRCVGSGLVRIVPGDPEASLVYLKVAAKAANTTPPCGDSMPQGADRPALSAAEMAALRDWILDGAMND